MVCSNYAKIKIAFKNNLVQYFYVVLLLYNGYPEILSGSLPQTWSWHIFFP